MPLSSKRVSGLIDDIYREWLEPPNSQSIQATLNVAVDADATTITYSDLYLSPEEQYMLAPGTLIEIGSELIRVGSVNTGDNILTDVKRGVNGTEAERHDVGEMIKLQPQHPRSTIFSLVSSSIAALWPPLYRVQTEDIVVGTSYSELPRDFIQPIQVLEMSGFTLTRIRVLPIFPESTTGKAAIFPDVAPSTPVMVGYRAVPGVPQTERDLLSDLGVDVTWERIVKVDVALEAASNSDIERLGGDFISERTELELNPIMAGSEIRQRLLAYREYLVERAIGQLDRQYGSILLSTRDWTFG